MAFWNYLALWKLFALLLFLPIMPLKIIFDLLENCVIIFVKLRLQLQANAKRVETLWFIVHILKITWFLTSPYPLLPYQSCTRIQNGIQTNSHQLWKGQGGRVAHCTDLTCVTPLLLYGRGILFESCLFSTAGLSN